MHTVSAREFEGIRLLIIVTISTTAWLAGMPSKSSIEMARFKIVNLEKLVNEKLRNSDHE